LAVNNRFNSFKSVFQVGGIEATGEPVVDVGEHRAPLVYCAV
jgi:hypothetical protein